MPDTFDEPLSAFLEGGDGPYEELEAVLRSVRRGEVDVRAGTAALAVYLAKTGAVSHACTVLRKDYCWTWHAVRTFLTDLGHEPPAEALDAEPTKKPRRVAAKEGVA